MCVCVTMLSVDAYSGREIALSFPTRLSASLTNHTLLPCVCVLMSVSLISGHYSDSMCVLKWSLAAGCFSSWSVDHKDWIDHHLCVSVCVICTDYRDNQRLLSCQYYVPLPSLSFLPYLAVATVAEGIS